MRSLPGPASALLPAALLLLAQGASAEPGRPLKIPGIGPAEAAYRNQLGRYADCLVGRAAARLVPFLNEGAGGRGAAKRVKQLAAAVPACARPRGGGPAEALLLRGAIFEALYRKDFAAAAPPAKLADVAPAGYGGKPGGDSTVATMRLGLFAVFDCAARTDPRRVAEMLRHPVGSAQEEEAFAGLAPTVAGCQPGGRRIDFPASVARPYMSEILYTLSVLRARPRP